MFEPSEILTLFESRMRELGLSQAQLSQRAFGKADSTAIQSLKKGSSPALDRVAAMADALDLELYLGPRRPKHVAAVAGLSESSGEAPSATQTQPKWEGVLPFPWHHQSRRPTSPPVLFRLDWLESNGLNPEDLCHVEPDEVRLSVEDSSGLLALVDRRAKPSEIAALWCYRLKGKSVLAHVQQDHRCLVVLPGTAERSAELYHGPDREKLTLLGRVVWLGFVCQNPKE